MGLRSSLVYRAKWARLGVIYARSPRLDFVRIGPHRVALYFPAEERSTHEHEFHKILIEDCYRLSSVDFQVTTVLDIGANIGLFALAARQHFPSATIHCYEPNRALEAHLTTHCLAIGAEVHMEAVGAHAGQISLHSNSGSLHSTTSPGGDIVQRSFGEIVRRLGRLDFLKLDCEGAEWDIFSEPAPWQHVQRLAMEYHLWARPNATTQDVVAAIRSLGFTNVNVEPSSNGPWGFAFAAR